MLKKKKKLIFTKRLPTDADTHSAQTIALAAQLKRQMEKHVMYVNKQCNIHTYTHAHKQTVTHRHTHAHTHGGERLRQNSLGPLRLRLRLALIDRSPRNSFSNWALSWATTALSMPKLGSNSCDGDAGAGAMLSKRTSASYCASSRRSDTQRERTLPLFFFSARFKTAFHCTHQTGLDDGDVGSDVDCN